MPNLDKVTVIAGLLMITLNLAALGPMATSAVPDAVADATATKPKDDVCANSDCTEQNEDWLSSTSSRDFYAWNIWNIDEVIETSRLPLPDQVKPEYEMVGPVTYDVTLERTMINHDELAGTITYREFTSYSCSEDTAIPCDSTISNLNIAFTPQIIGASGTAINAIMELTKVGFASGVLELYLEKGSAAHQVSKYIEDFLKNMSGLAGFFFPIGEDVKAYFLVRGFEALDPVFGENFLENDNSTYLESGGVDPDWYDDDYDANYTFREATGPNGEDLSLLNYLGPLVYAAMGEPESLDEILENPDSSVTLQRAELWGFTDEDLNVTLSRDWTIYGSIGALMQDYGALQEDWTTNTSEDVVNASKRFSNLMGLQIDNEIAMNVLMMGDNTDEPLGILATSESGTSFGLDLFLEMSKSEAMETYGLSELQYQSIFDWANSWATDNSELPLILTGHEGYITASEFVNQTFGSINPIDDSYMEYSLNANGWWGSGLYGFPVADRIELTQEQSANILYGPYGLATSNGSAIFLYGELSGKAPPVDFETGLRSDTVKEWNNETIAELYGIDTNAADALRLLIMEVIFKNFVPDFLIDNFGTAPYLTQSVNNWLLGWHDPVNAYLDSGDSEDMSVGWTSLESNKTYYGSGGISTGDGTIVTICTGESDDCDKGETLSKDGSTYLSWKNPQKELATWGLITAESMTGTTGGFLTGDGDLVDLSGYGVVPITCSKDEILKGIPVEVCNADMDPLNRPIQAKLINNGDILDATPGALPVYFESHVEVKREVVSGAIIAGKSESTFWLDTRPTWEQQEPPSNSDLQQVFVIKTSAEIGDSDANSLKSQIVTNQDSMAYWTNFDHWADYLTIALYSLGLICILLGSAMIFKNSNTRPDEEEFSSAFVEESVNLTQEETLEVESMQEEESEEKDDELTEATSDDETTD
ncbi:MAG: hypothetical protein QGI21_05650 [Candidatus Poseidoniaceae archaeon]|jgi:hypothetical protein|nr:hypothetical protein [Candidatus Poseidoniaceae archaeon]